MTGRRRRIRILSRVLDGATRRTAIEAVWSHTNSRPARFARYQQGRYGPPGYKPEAPCPRCGGRTITVRLTKFCRDCGMSTLGERLVYRVRRGLASGGVEDAVLALAWLYVRGLEERKGIWRAVPTLLDMEA